MFITYIKYILNVLNFYKGEDDANHGEEAESANNVQDSLEYEETSSEDDLQSETSVSPAANDCHPNRSSKQKGKSHQRSPNQPPRDHGHQMQGRQRTVT